MTKSNKPVKEKSAAERLTESLATGPSVSQIPSSIPKHEEGRNKYVWLVATGGALLASGLLYRTFFLAKESVPVVTGKVKEYTVIAKKDEWRFLPEDIEVDRGDKVILTVVNEDDYDHGIAIDAFGISQRMPALQTIKVEFTATQIGEFPYYCSVPCGEGEVNGEKRGHFDMIGKVKVRDTTQK